MMPMPELYTIGVYGWDAEHFFAALQAAQIDTFCDIRARRGVRGSEYTFANSQRLQERLAELGIRYVHRPELAPSPATREAQHEADEASHTARRQRSTLSRAFIDAYEREQLGHFDSAAFVSDLGPDVRRVVLMCVEREPSACHRGLLAGRLSSDLGLEVTHLRP
jgi:uncharacterized protein (DUF488 family)